MKADIHPKHYVTEVRCSCGNTFHVMAKAAKMSVDICSACHPFYTGTQKFIDTAGRVEAFTKRFQWSGDKAKDQAKKVEVKAAPTTAAPKKEDLKTQLERKRLFSAKREIPVIEEEEEQGGRGRGGFGGRGGRGGDRGGPRGPRGPRAGGDKGGEAKAEAPKAEAKADEKK